jgi:hypothetical protein
LRDATRPADRRSAILWMLWHAPGKKAVPGKGTVAILTQGLLHFDQGQMTWTGRVDEAQADSAASFTRQTISRCAS